jgi:hypothetical protein
MAENTAGKAQGPISAKGFGPSSGTGGAPATTQTDPNTSQGQAGGDLETQGQAQAGQHAATGQQTGSQVNGAGTQGKTGSATGEPTYFDPNFDPKTLPPELQGVYKALQGAYTKKTTAIAAERQKVEAYDAFLKDPQGVLENLARQYGLTLTRGGQPQGQAPNGQAGGQHDAQGQNPFANPNYQPTSWGQVAQDLSSVIVPLIVNQISQQLGGVVQPLYQSVEKITSNHVEAELDKVDPNWRVYEDDIKANMRNHPTLIKDPSGIKKLYLLSVPEEVIEARASSAAVAKLQDKAKSLQVGSRSQATHTATAPTKVNSFAEAVAVAKKQLGQQT